MSEVKLEGIPCWKCIIFQNRQQIGGMSGKTNSIFDIKKYQKLHLRMSINGTNEEEEQLKITVALKSDQDVTFYNSLSVN